jgi:hypothetical protein
MKSSREVEEEAEMKKRWTERGVRTLRRKMVNSRPQRLHANASLEMSQAGFET